jgi:paired amphipathic helix protein Sin3a
MQAQSNVSVKESSQKVFDNAPKQLSVSPPSQRKRPHSPMKDLSSSQETSSLTMSHFIAQPESYQYNACVERQFFDAAKEALSMYSRDEAWPSFLKIIDMYGQQTITRSEMLETVEELFGKRNELFDQFKKIVTAAGSPDGPSHDGAWHSVPLSEIDFSRCRKCTPSYRALPRDYPTPPCSERSDEERKVLNDVWVSLPVGSEESYTFRHMRKNQHEEILFRCEDERFEIDMVIDSNASTLRRLEPIAEEIALLQQREIVTSSNGSKLLSKGGVSGKVFQYSFDGKVLNTIHRHSISRIYGDSGPEILKLILKNPVVAVPVVVSRLRQKDKEFRAARETLNLRWKELAEHNYFKSLDHRSLNWRNIDKRATSTKTLVAEIKDRETALLARREKAKEEHGSFYEITMGRYLSRKTGIKECPKPTVELFTSHLSFVLENVSWAQRDAFRIMSFALERGIVSPSDKEICHRLLRDFLAPFLGLSLNMIMSPAVSYVASTTLSPSVVTHSEDSGIDDDESSTEDLDIVGNNMTVTEETDRKKTKTTSDVYNSDCLLDHQPIPRGSNILTIYGEANLIEYRRLDQIYVVSLPYGAVAYLHPKAILCSIMGPTEIPSDAVEQYNNSDEECIEDSLFIGPQSVYVFFRLYDVLVKRLNTARRLADEVSGNSTYQSLVEKLSSDNSPDSGRVRYETYLSLVYDLVEGASSSGISTNDLEGGKYEDRVRSLLGHGAYELATMDKLMSSLQKNLQNMANDDTVQAMIQVFRIQHDSGSFKPLAFKQEASIASKGDNKGEHKNMFAFQYCKVPGSDKTVFHMEFLGDITDHDESSQNGDEDNDVEMGDLNERVEGPTAKRPKR